MVSKSRKRKGPLSLCLSSFPPSVFLLSSLFLSLICPVASPLLKRQKFLIELLFFAGDFLELQKKKKKKEKKNNFSSEDTPPYRHISQSCTVNFLTITSREESREFFSQLPKFYRIPQQYDKTLLSFDTSQKPSTLFFLMVSPSQLSFRRHFIIGLSLFNVSCRGRRDKGDSRSRFVLRLLPSAAADIRRVYFKKREIHLAFAPRHEAGEHEPLVISYLEQ